MAIILTIITIIAIVVGLVLFIIAQTRKKAGATLVKNIPDYVKTLEMFIAEHFSTTEVFDELWNQVLSMGENIIKVVGQVTQEVLLVN